MAYKRKEQIGDATLYLGDCLENPPTLSASGSAEINEKRLQIDAVITDPPYGIGFPYAGYDDSRENLKRLIDGFMPFAKNCKRAAITPGNTQLWIYPEANWVGAWTWDTTTSCGKLGWSQVQPILFYGEDVSKGTASLNGVLKTDRIHFSGGSAKINSSDGQIHTCPKPYEFMKKMVARFSISDEVVLDPFMGSGTTGVACANLGRKFIGIEIEEKYFDIACERIAAAYAQGKLF